ncbi:TerB N-terminal domain-containing protein [Paenibacillus rhizophilus]|uniref:TerB-C domain-containing protein n=1 Tax=Paenibacillus rhizophilus TaxID=1850366 RepID=A0A3N9PBI8_9BACL|nr:TerB N-terminal domain-containing protein [Paenibacillus rhizophilus]RQW13608.1 hypothetical protein EH198_04165 [Paenibacillus rhizophilus]
MGGTKWAVLGLPVMERDRSMSYDDKPHFSELIWEGDEKNMAVPPREAVREVEAKRAAEADKNRRLKESRSMPERPEQLKLWDLELSGRREEKRGGLPSAAVPRRDEIVKDKETASSSRPATTESQFVEHARELADYTENSAEFVKFKSYWPTYGHMTGSQTKWYFYWRNEVRHGRYPETDLSYIFLHIYELINGVGWDTPQNGCAQLSGLWEAYRGTFKRLDHYLGGWIADFSFIHKLNIPLREIVVRAKGLGGDLAELELKRCLTSAPEQLTLTALSLMSDYDITKSKFYAGPGNEVLERFVPQVVGLVNTYVTRKHGASLLEMFPPGPPAMRERYLFRSAVYDISQYGYSVLVPVVRISKSPPLRSLITRLFRLTENKLRALMDYRGRLKGISIDKDIEELVSKFLEREFRKAEREEKGPDIVIDKDKLERLRGDSEVVRHLLTVDEPAEEKTVGDWPVTEMPSVDESNAVVLDAQGSEAINEAQTAADKPQTSSLMPENEWEAMAGALSPLQCQAVLALSGTDGPAELRRLAAAQAALPDLLIDEINDVAMDVLGDLLIDGEELSPEHVTLLQYLKR